MSKLQELETIVDDFMASRWEAAKALKTIRDDQLYKETHKTFEEYVKARYSKSRDWAYKLIDWIDANELMQIEKAEDAISVVAAKALSSVMKKHTPAKVKQVTKKAEAIAKAKGHTVPTSADFKEAKREVVPTSGATSKQEERPVKPDEYQIALTIDGDNEQELVKLLIDQDCDIQKHRGKFVENTNQPEMLLSSLTAFVSRTDQVKMTINVNKVRA